MRQAANESDSVGEQHFALRGQVHAADRRVERRKHARRFQHLSLGQRVEQRRLPRIRIAHQGDGRDRRRLAPLPLLRANAPNVFNLPFTFRTRRAMFRRSVSSFVSPGPRVPMPPPSCDISMPCPANRGSMYCNCASSTCNWPSRVRACRAKMSRMSCVRSIARRWMIFSILRCWEGLRSWSNRRTSASAEAAAPAIPRACPRQSRSRDRGGHAAAESGRHGCAGTLGQRAQLGQRLVRIELRNARLAGLNAAAPAFAGCMAAASRAADACAVTVPFAPLRPRVRTSIPTRNARSRSGSWRTTGVPRGTRRPARARAAGFLGM